MLAPSDSTPGMFCRMRPILSVGAFASPPKSNLREVRPWLVPCST